MFTKIFNSIKTPGKIFLSLVGLMLLAFTATAHAADAVVSDSGSWLDVAKPVYSAVMAGHYLAAAALALVFAVAMVKAHAGKFPKYGPALEKAVHTDMGGVITTFAMSFFGAIATATAATGSGWSGLTYKVFKMSGGVAILAIGGYVGIKKFLIPLLKPITAKAPAWMQPFFSMLYWAFDQKSPTETAEAAGAKAVEAAPAQGTAAVVGKPNEIE